jgi:hypothetical protein
MGRAKTHCTNPSEGSSNPSTVNPLEKAIEPMVRHGASWRSVLTEDDMASLREKYIFVNFIYLNSILFF